MEDLSWYPKRRTDLTVREVDGETLVLDRRFEKIHQLNLTASYIWGRCDGLSSIEDIGAAVAVCFDISSATAEEDVKRIISQFQALGLLERAEESNSKEE